MEDNFWVLAIILLAIEIKISIGLPQCSLRGDGHWINSVKINMEDGDFFVEHYESTITNKIKIQWAIDLQKDQEIDGYVIYFAESGLDPDERQTLYPKNIADNCYKSLLHLSTLINTSPNCSAKCENACTCNISDCPSVNETECWGPLREMTRHYSGSPFTVPAAEINILEFEVGFNTEYTLRIVPYYRQFARRNVTGTEFVFTSGFCPESLLSKSSSELTIDQSLELCCQHGYNDYELRNISLENIIPDFESQTVNVTLYFTSHFSNSSRYNMYIYEEVSDIYPEYGEIVLASQNLEEKCLDQKTIYATLLYHMQLGVQYSLIITPNACSGCYTVFKFNVPEINTCDEKWSYCDRMAICKHSINETTCTCRDGYEGDGILAGTGCAEIDECQNDPCSDFAMCMDLSAPNTGFNCSCKEGYYGDGFSSGSGCKSTTVLALAVSLPISLFLVILVAGVLAWKKIINQRRKDQMFSVFQVETEKGILNIFEDEASCMQAPWEPTFGNKWELERSEIELGEVIGRGNYGVVYKGQITKPNNDDHLSLKNGHINGFYENDVQYDSKEKQYIKEPQSINVAVKTLQECHMSHANLADFLAEIGFLINVGKHNNVLSIYGCCTTDKPVLLITEYLRHGNLLHFLWDARDPSNSINKDVIYGVTHASLTNMAICVAKGMEHLSKLRIIHGDIAARNILIGENGDCKIADFGLANDVYRYGALKNHSERFVPFKWISPERMMEGRVPITYKSDVWSFGILLYEIFTLGCSPFSGIESEHLLQKLTDGYRMPQPDSCSTEIYDVMMKCWKWRQSSRPSFGQVIKYLSVAVNNKNFTNEIVRNNLQEIQHQHTYDDELTKFKAERVNSAIDEGYVESSCGSDASSTGDAKNVYEEFDSAHEESPKLPTANKI